MTRVIAEPVMPKNPINPRMRLNVLISAVIGFMFLSFFRYFMKMVLEEKRVKWVIFGNETIQIKRGEVGAKKIIKGQKYKKYT